MKHIWSNPSHASGFNTETIEHGASATEKQHVIIFFISYSHSQTHQLISHCSVLPHLKETPWNPSTVILVCAIYLFYLSGFSFYPIPCKSGSAKAPLSVTLWSISKGWHHVSEMNFQFLFYFTANWFFLFAIIISTQLIQLCS